MPCNINVMYKNCFIKTFKYLITYQVLQLFYFVFLLKCGKEIFSSVANQHRTWQGLYL